MEYDTIRIDRRITQAFKARHESQGACAMTWRQAIAQLLIREAGLVGEQLPPAPPKLAPGRPKTDQCVVTAKAQTQDTTPSQQAPVDNRVHYTHNPPYQWTYETRTDERYYDQLKELWWKWSEGRKEKGLDWEWETFFKCLNAGEIEYDIVA